jgi:predicted DNA-binding protein (MmcQ/YjbR family)
MTLDEYREYCHSFKGITEEFPFDETTLVYKVGGKIFTLTDINSYEHVSVKCDPEDALAYREIYESVIPGYHLNKRHWNSVNCGGDVPDETLKGWIRDSYDLVVKSLTKKLRVELGLG